MSTRMHPEVMCDHSRPSQPVSIIGKVVYYTNYWAVDDSRSKLFGLIVNVEQFSNLKDNDPEILLTIFSSVGHITMHVPIAGLVRLIKGEQLVLRFSIAEALVLVC